MIEQEEKAFKKLGESMLQRSGRITTLQSNITSYKAECKDSAEAKKIDKPCPGSWQNYSAQSI